MQNPKVARINLEAGRPTAAEAVSKMLNSLITLKRQGYKAAILIHGYGSSGTGGSIKEAVQGRLGEESMRGIVRAFVAGEKWPQRKREFLGLCKALGDFEREISYNAGVTVVVLR